MACNYCIECKENKEYCRLVQKAKELVALYPSADQVIVVQTGKSNIYHFVNCLYVDGQFEGKSEAEENFVQMLLCKKEQELKYIVCMWNDYSIDVPTTNFRQLLMAASVNNADAMLVLQSASGLILKRLKVSIPMRVDVDKTRQYYDSIKSEDLCDCGNCINYYLQIKKEYPLLTTYLNALGIDVEKPHETSPIVMYDKGFTEYYVQYVIIGTKPSVYANKIGDVAITIAESYPSTNIEEEHFVVDLYPIRLKWDSKEENL